ncbi:MULTISPECIES: Maf family protein [unclassified Iodidimonas]|jgi:septum formation protein|uniref:Maf family protein n=1 Tax=unclassified Iodidimonas TaxID=2626145 RepID=UPI002482551F|nr:MULTISPECIES: Maf family protein [unclassified Iodidimonas]
MNKPLILASKSPVRAKMLRDAGLFFEVKASALDEQPIKDHCLAQDEPDLLAIAPTLARQKALDISHDWPGSYVIGADQTLIHDQTLLSKAADESSLRQQLLSLRGQTHHLHSAVALAFNGAILWQWDQQAVLWMRHFSDAFLDHYLALGGEALYQSVGGYCLEAEGVQLFDRIEGDYFSILGLPLLPLLEFLRTEKLILK